MKFLKLFRRKKVELVSMTELTEWQIYQEMSHVERIKDLLKLKEQVGYIKFAESRGEQTEWLGYAQFAKDILYQMEHANEEIIRLTEKPKVEEPRGYKENI